MTPITDLLNHCTVRVDSEQGQGTGFFVAPGLIVTCHHVLGDISARSIVPITWGQNSIGAIFQPLPHPEEWDLALLRTDETLRHPCALLHPEVSLHDRLYCFGYTRDYQDGESAVFESEGESLQPRLLKLKGSQAQFGLSGAPLLNLRTGAVCGVLRRSRNVQSDLGARAIPAVTLHWLIETRFKDFRVDVQRYHENNPTWVDYVTSLEFEQSLGPLTASQLIEHVERVDWIERAYNRQRSTKSNKNISRLALIIGRVLTDFPVENLSVAGLRRGENISKLYLTIAEFIDRFESLCDEVIHTFMSGGADPEFHGNAKQFRISVANRKLRSIATDMRELSNSLRSLLEEDSVLRRRLEVISDISSEIVVVHGHLDVMLNERFYDYRGDEDALSKYQMLLDELESYRTKLREAVATQDR